TNDTISVSFDYADADGDTQSGTSYQWQKKGPADSGFSDISGATSSSLNLDTHGNRQNGDHLNMPYNPKDSTDLGAQVASNLATVADTAPIETHSLHDALPI